MMKRVLLAMLAGLVAFGMAQDYEMVDPSGQTVVFWHQHTRDREASLQEIVADFNANNEYGITVVAEYQGGYGDIYAKMIPVLGSSDAPNLVVAYQNQAADYAIGEGMVDITPLVTSAKWGLTDEEMSDFFAGFISADIFPSFDNARYGFPPNRSMELVYYNTEWLAELGFDGPPSTPEEFREMACAASENPFSKATSEGSIGYEISLDASRFASWTFAFGGNIFDADNNAYTYDSPEAVAAMTFLQELVDAGCASIVTEAYGDQTNFGAGRTLFTVGSTSGIPFYQSAIDEGSQHAWSVAPVPHVTEDPVTNIYGASVSVASGHSPEANLATWLFIKYYTSTDIQAKWATASNYFPVRQSVADDLGGLFEELPAYETAFNLLAYGISEPSVPGYQGVRDMITIEMAAIMDGADVERTLAFANVEANNILKDQLADMQ